MEHTKAASISLLSLFLSPTTEKMITTEQTTTRHKKCHPRTGLSVCGSVPGNTHLQILKITVNLEILYDGGVRLIEILLNQVVKDIK